jgi:preprotein translocase subunit SecB
MKTSDLLLDNYFINELNYSLRNDFDETVSNNFEAPLLAVKCHYEKITDDSNKRKCEIEIGLSENSKANFPYKFKIVMSGLFTISTEIDAEAGERLFRVNAPSLLYSTARVILYNLTNYSGHLPFMLPSVTFIDEAEPIVVDSKPIKKKVAKPRKKKE